MTSGPDFIFKEDGAAAAVEDRRSWSEVSVHWRSRSKSLPLSFTAEQNHTPSSCLLVSAFTVT